MVAMQIRGRHRGLPYELDRAIMLPSESLHRKEDEDAKQRMMTRRNSGLHSTSRRPSQSGTVREPNRPSLSVARSQTARSSNGEKRD